MISDQGMLHLRAKLAAHRRWAQVDVEGRSAATAMARRGLQERFEREADPDGTLDAAQRQVRIAEVKKAFYAEACIKAAQTRAARKAQRKNDLADNASEAARLQNEFNLAKAASLRAQAEALEAISAVPVGGGRTEEGVDSGRDEAAAAFAAALQNVPALPATGPDRRPIEAPAKTNLTDRQRRIVEFIGCYVSAHGFVPSIREIGVGVGLRGSSAVNYQLGKLELAGVLTKAPNKPRAYALVDVAPVAEPCTVCGRTS